MDEARLKIAKPKKPRTIIPVMITSAAETERGIHRSQEQITGSTRMERNVARTMVMQNGRAKEQKTISRATTIPPSRITILFNAWELSRSAASILMEPFRKDAPLYPPFRTKRGAGWSGLEELKKTVLTG